MIRYSSYFGFDHAKISHLINGNDNCGSYAGAGQASNPSEELFKIKNAEVHIYKNYTIRNEIMGTCKLML